MEVIARDEVKPFITEEGSEICELFAPRNSKICHQSLAEEILQPGQATQEHYHPQAEEIYYILQGKSPLRIEAKEQFVGSGDVIAILSS